VGDDDPLDICEIGSKAAKCGRIKKVKPLGAFAVLDESETDWKVVAIDVADALAGSLSDVGDVDNHLPGLLESLKKWYCNYKVPDGNEPNSIALDGKVMDRQ
jgi:inorganic pyrophosphatase